MGVEKIRHRLKELTNHKLRLDNINQFTHLTSAVNDFLGHEATLTFTNLPGMALRVEKKPKNIQLNIMDFDHETNQWYDRFFNLVSKQLTSREQEDLKNKKILMIRRKHPDPKFKEAVRIHGETFHGGATILTELTLPDDCNGNPNPPNEKEKQSTDLIKTIATNSIKFYSLTEDPEAIALAEEISKLADPYELIYAIYLTINSLNKTANKGSFASICLGLVGEPILEKITGVFGNQTSQIVSQLAGEFTTMLIAAGDRIGGVLLTPQEDHTLKEYFGIMTQTFHNLPTYFKGLIINQAKNLNLLKENTRDRLIVLGLILGAVVGLSHLSTEYGSLVPYAFIPALNSSLITAYEIHERAKGFRQICLNDEDFKKLLNKIPQPLKNIFKRLGPAYTLAYNDFYVNDYAVGALLGAFLESISVLPLQKMGVSNEWIYSLSGLVIEPATAVVFNYLRPSDPYEKFVNYLVT